MPKNLPNIIEYDKTDNSKHKQKRNMSQREDDLRIFARMYLQGTSLLQITQWVADNRPYTLSWQQIEYDLAELRKRWIKAQMIDFNEAKSKELSHIDHLEEVYWHAWEQSLLPQTTEYQEKTDDIQDTGPKRFSPTYSRKKQKRETKTTTGDAKFLQGVQWCINKRCQILGLNAPEKLQVDWRQEAEKEGINASDVFERMVEEILNAGSVDGKNGDGGLEGSSETQE